MNRNLAMAAVAACLIWPVASVTQEAPQPRARARPRVRVETGPFDGVYAFTTRGRIGVLVDTKADAAGDKIGARIEGITPGGPAEKAGLKAQDIITRFNTTALGGASAEDDETSGPGMKLIELAHKLEPGDTVQIEYRRGNDSRKTTIVAEELPMTGHIEMPGMPGMGAMEEMLPKLRMQGGPGEFEFAFGSPWGGIELVKLNPDLGDYFGTREGVLVVRAPEDSSLSLKGGDVILSIGSRKPSSPEQAMRILRSYDTGETVTLDVLRKQKHITVRWKVPEENRKWFHVAPRAREEPSWFRARPKLRPPRPIRVTRVI
jgi:S1-C subfamily serine protease